MLRLLNKTKSETTAWVPHGSEGSLQLSNNELRVAWKAINGQRDPERNAADAASTLTENFDDFANGRRSNFDAYFVLESALHRSIQRRFLAKISLPDYCAAENPNAAQPEIILAQNGIILSRQSNIDSGRAPFDVSYSALRYEAPSDY